MRFLRRSIVGLCLASLTLGLLVYSGYLISDAVQTRLSQERPEPPVRERVYTVNLVTARTSSETPVTVTFGEVRTRRTLELRAAVAGRVVALSPAFEDGGQVSAGDVLVRIDPADLEAAVDRLTADLADAEAEVREAARGLDLAQEDLDAARQQARLRDRALSRQLDLAARGVGTTATVEDAEIAAASAQAGVITRRLALAEAEARTDRGATTLSRARIALQEAQRDLEETTVRAPFSGTLSATTVVEGGLVAANEKLADLVDPSDLEVVFRLSTAQYARLLDADGTLLPAPLVAVLENAEGDLSARGVLSRVSAGVDAGEVGRIVFGRLTSAVGFQPGDFVTLQISEPPLNDVVRLPASAYHADGHVLVTDGESRLNRLEVILVRRQGDDVLLQAVDLPGREVVQHLSPLLGEGIAVQPIRTGTEDAAAVSLLELSDARRARLIAFVENDAGMAQEDKARVLAQLSARTVPRQVVDQLERRIGG